MDIVGESYYRRSASHRPPSLWLGHVPVAHSHPLIAPPSSQTQGRVQPELLRSDTNLHISICKAIPVQSPAVLPSVLHLKMV